MFKFEKCKSSFVSDEYENLNDLLRDSSTLKTVGSLKGVQAIQILVPKLANHQQFNLSKSSTLNYFLDGLYNKQDDSLKYVLIKNCPIHFILHPHFLVNYVQKGDLNIQTTNFINELDDYISFQDGILLICVNQVTYTRLGLVGRLAYGYKKKFNLRKYLVELDLKDRLFYEFNSKHYQRTFNALKNSAIKLDLMIKWSPQNDCCSPLSLLRFFDMLKFGQFKNDEFFDEQSFQTITIHQCAPNIRKFELDQFAMPLFDEELKKEDKIFDKNEKDQNHKESFSHSKIKTLIDLVGLALTGSYSQTDEDDEVNTLRLDKSKLTNLICLEITGFFMLNNIRTILSEFFELIKLNPELDYAVLIVNGFEKSIRSWSGQSNFHLKHLSGENLYGLFLSRYFSNFIWRIADKTDFGIEKL